MAKNRTKNSIRNVLFSFIGYIFTILLQFINRSVFVRLLSAEYLGLNGLFSNILSLLALSELGIGTAMTYALYKPISNRDTEKIKSLMHLYKKMYTIIGCFVLGVGCAIAPFLPYFIEDMPALKFITVYYLLYVLNSGVSYFYTYKRTLIICDQNAYISTTTQTIASVLTKLVQIIALLLTHNYLLFLLVQIFFTIAENIVISKIADKRYPFLKESNISKLEQTEKDNISKNIKAMLCHKIGFVAVTATDNLILSKILGLVSVGLYSNYSLIMDNVAALTDRMIFSVSASVGDLIAEDDTKHSEQVLYNLLFINYWVISFCATCLYCLLQDFIVLWLGKDFLLSSFTVLVIVLCFYVSRMRNTVNIFKEATGILRQDRYKAIIESIVNLALSIPLTYQFGVAGVKLGTLLSTLLIPFWIEGYVLFKHYFHKSFKWYMLKQAGYLLSFSAVTLLTAMTCNLVPYEGLLAFVLKLIICCIVPNVIIAALFFKTDGFKYLSRIIFKLFATKIRKKAH